MSIDSSKAKVLITGATGFVGRALSARVTRDGRHVRALSRRYGNGPWREHVALDIGTDADFGAALDGVDTVFHLAALTHDVHAHADDEAYKRINIDGTRRLVAAASAAGVGRVVFLSSVKAMGEGGAEAMDESSLPAPASAYGRSKLEAERIVHDGDIAQTCVLRSSLVYGPGVKGNIARMVHAVRRGAFPPLPHRRNKRAMVHVEDLADALLLGARKPLGAGATYVITDGRSYSTRDMYEWIVAALGKGVPRWHVPWATLVAMARCGDLAGRITGRPMPLDSVALDKLMGSAWYTSIRAQADLGFEPRHSLQSAMPEIVRSLL